MSPLLSNVSSQLLSALNGKNSHQKWLDCSNKYPWYAIPWVMLAGEQKDEAAKQKAALWFANEKRLHWLLTSQPMENDSWLTEQLKALKNPETSKPLSLPEKSIPNTRPENTVTVETAPFLDEKKQDGVEEIDTKIAFAKIKDAETEEEKKANDTDAITEDIIISVLDEKAERPIPPLIISARPAKSDLLFEPFYAVDYFASQGIKLENTESQNKVDKQVKSFTQWLKTMKQVNFKPDESKISDPKVDAQANASIAEKETLTEAMAEVLIMQGKNKKAAEIYQKLILLHPEKSTYFAARLTDLKDKQ